MLNLNPIFLDAVVALERHGERVLTPPLPAAIFMFQRDVLNHYRHAFAGYWPTPLDAAHLQNSSLGSPYDKWSKFVNDDFALLTFSVHCLVRYTSRLFHEATAEALCDERRFEEMKARSNDYTDPIHHFRYRAIGFHAEADRVVTVTPFGPELVASRWDISDRLSLEQLQERCEAEIDALSESHGRFAKQCDRFHARRALIADYEAMNQSWWV